MVKFSILTIVLSVFACGPAVAASPENSDASIQHAREGQAGPDDPEMVMIDRLAAEFYENSLRRAQTLRIEQNTADTYRTLSQSERQEFRSQRRRVWQTLNASQKQALRNVKTPMFLNLTETQKRPFRATALRELTAGSTSSASAPSSAGQNDI